MSAFRGLQAELDVLSAFLETANDQQALAIAQTLQHWQQDPDLASLRGDAIDSLPEPERASWRTVWSRVETLRLRATPSPAEDKPEASSGSQNGG